MAQIKKVVEGLEILAKAARVQPGPDERGVTDPRCVHLGGAGDEVIYGPAADPSADDAERLEGIGWHWDSESGCWAMFV